MCVRPFGLAFDELRERELKRKGRVGVKIDEAIKRQLFTTASQLAAALLFGWLPSSFSFLLLLLLFLLICRSVTSGPPTEGIIIANTFTATRRAATSL